MAPNSKQTTLEFVVKKAAPKAVEVKTEVEEDYGHVVLPDPRA